jgi:ribosomal protein L11 methyltransferase
MPWLAIALEVDAAQAGPLSDAPLFAARARAGARIALCGVLEDQAAPVIAAYDPDFDLCIERVRDGWVLLAGTRR